MRTEQEMNRAVEQYSDMILRLCTVFLKYALSKKYFESAEHEKAWLIRVASNQCKDMVKSFFRKYSVSLAAVTSAVSPSMFWLTPSTTPPPFL